MSPLKPQTAFEDAANRRSRAFAEGDGAAAAILDLPFLNMQTEQRTLSTLNPSKPRPLDKPQRAKNLFGRAEAFVTFRRKRFELLKSGLFDREWYLQHNPDVVAAGVDPLEHFLKHGAFEGRSPGPAFDPAAYLDGNPDVAATQIEPWRHFALHGKDEGRSAASRPAPDKRRSPGSTVSRSLHRLARARRLTGHIDSFDAGGLRGWVLDPANPDAPVEVSLYVDSTLVARTAADDFRSDILAIGAGDGHCGFNIPIAKRVYFEGHRADVFARINGGDVLFGRFDLVRDPVPRLQDRPTVHMDLSDLVAFMSRHSKVSGIQRVQVGMMLGLMDVAERTYDLRFCARHEFSKFVDVEAARLRALLAPAASSDENTLVQWQELLKATFSPSAEKTAFRPGDVLLTIGAPWSIANHAEAIRALKLEGVFYFQLLHDIVPITMPEVVDANSIPSFVSSVASLVTQADRIFVYSQFSRKELETAALGAGATLPPCDVIGLGNSLTNIREGDSASSDAGTMESLSHWGIHGEFVLCIGTIEPRKNHVLLYNVWRRLLKEHRASTPELVLVGRIGWYMEGFIRSLQATEFLDHKVVIVENASDQLLQTLYKSCLFTVFPSLYEGWGLPIVESFANGKVCVCSSAAAMPEAGQDLAVYIDPENASGAFEIISDLIFDRALLREKEGKVQRQFRPTLWASAAEQFSGRIDAAIRLLCPGESAARPLLLRSNNRYYFEAAMSHQSARRQFASHVLQSQLASIRHGSHWYEVENDRCWACGATAALQFYCDTDARAVLIEICATSILWEQICTVRLNDEFIGTFALRAGYSVLNVPFTTRTAPGTVRLDMTCEVYPASQSGSEKRLLGLGIFSIMTYDCDSGTAFETFLARERRSRNRDMKELMQNVVELGIVETGFLGVTS